MISFGWRVNFFRLTFFPIKLISIFPFFLKVSTLWQKLNKLTKMICCLLHLLYVQTKSYVCFNVSWEEKIAAWIKSALIYESPCSVVLLTVVWCGVWLHKHCRQYARSAHKLHQWIPFSGYALRTYSLKLNFNVRTWC